MCSNIKEPLLIGGDFNILRFSSEKNKSFLPNRFSNIFDSLIEKYIFLVGNIPGQITKITQP
jgi:hypothetical protein